MDSVVLGPYSHVAGTTSKLKILRIKMREYRDGIKTRLGWGEAHNVREACIGITEAFKADLYT